MRRLLKDHKSHRNNHDAITLVVLAYKQGLYRLVLYWTEQNSLTSNGQQTKTVRSNHLGAHTQRAFWCPFEHLRKMLSDKTLWISNIISNLHLFLRPLERSPLHDKMSLITSCMSLWYSKEKERWHSMHVKQWVVWVRLGGPRWAHTCFYGCVWSALLNTLQSAKRRWNAQLTVPEQSSVFVIK